MSSTILQPTATERFSKSIGGSIKSVMNAGSRTYFMLEHKTSSSKHHMGESTQFIGDYVELGRGNKYAVNFGDDCPTVSRPHAAILRKGTGWVLKPLSKTNPTLLNGQRINDETPMNNGDELQLSLNGPKLAFLTPVNNKVGTMGMTIRMKAFMNEAVKPYKKALSVITIAFLLIIGGLVYYGKKQNDYYAVLFKNQTDINKSLADSIAKVNADKIDVQRKLKKMGEDMDKVNKLQAGNGGNGGNSGSGGSGGQVVDNGNSSLRGLYPNVYFIVTDKVVFTIGSTTKELDFKISGTGFLLSDGRFVTARHVVNPWSFAKLNADDEGNKTELLLNVIANNGGKVVLYMTAFSPDGSKFSFTSEDFNLDNSQDDKKSKTDEEGNTYTFSQANFKDGSDWAYAKTNKRGALASDPQLSVSLAASTRLTVLGYPFAIGANGSSDIKPVYSECQVSRDGLDGGIIDVSNRGFDQGNSGGPVFAQVNGGYVVIGIVSAEIGNQGIFVPIRSIR